MRYPCALPPVMHRHINVQTQHVRTLMSLWRENLKAAIIQLEEIQGNSSWICLGMYISCMRNCTQIHKQHPGEVLISATSERRPLLKGVGQDKVRMDR